MGQERVSAVRQPHPESQDRFVIEDFVAAAIGLALLVYLAYALVRLERF
jgi:hypothetical protein